MLKRLKSAWLGTDWFDTQNLEAEKPPKLAGVKLGGRQAHGYPGENLFCNSLWASDIHKKKKKKIGGIWKGYKLMWKNPRRRHRYRQWMGNTVYQINKLWTEPKPRKKWARVLFKYARALFYQGIWVYFSFYGEFSILTCRQPLLIDVCY